MLCSIVLRIPKYLFFGGEGGGGRRTSDNLSTFTFNTARWGKMITPLFVAKFEWFVASAGSNRICSDDIR